MNKIKNEMLGFINAKRNERAWCQWLMPVILATWEILVQGQPRKIDLQAPPSPK
jgi:hypothetical protein